MNAYDKLASIAADTSEALAAFPNLCKFARDCLKDGNEAEQAKGFRIVEKVMEANQLQGVLKAYEKT